MLALARLARCRQRQAALHVGGEDLIHGVSGFGQGVFQILALRHELGQIAACNVELHSGSGMNDATSVGGSTPRWSTITALGISQTLAWASTYYLPAVLAAPMAREFGVSVQLIFAAFSAALVIFALLGPYAGRSIDRLGGRPVLMGTSLIFALGLALLSLATGPISLFVAWAVLGVGMGSGLYEAAFATLVRLHGRNTRGAISGVTLFAGFASTVGWPLSAVLETHYGWRGTCLAWAGLHHLLIGLPLYWLVAEGVERPRDSRPRGCGR